MLALTDLRVCVAAVNRLVRSLVYGATYIRPWPPEPVWQVCWTCPAKWGHLPDRFGVRPSILGKSAEVSVVKGHNAGLRALTNIRLAELGDRSPP